MIKKMWIAECDVCGCRENAKAEHGRYNDLSYVLPEGWSKAHNDNFILCPECRTKLERID